jgi:ATP-binding cassette, subfamily B, bacterial MsbA
LRSKLASWLGSNPVRRLIPLQPYPHIWAVAEQFLRSLPLLIALSLLGGLLETCSIALLVPLLSTLTGSTAQGSGSVARVLGALGGSLQPHARLFFIAAVIIVLVAAKGVVETTTRILSGWMEGRFGHALRVELARRIYNAPYLLHLRQSASRLVHILDTESWSASSAFRELLFQTSAIAAVCIFGGVLLLFDWQLTLIVVAATVLLRILRWAFIARLRRSSERLAQENVELADRTSFAVYFAKLVRLLRQESAEVQRFSDASDRVRSAVLRMEALSGALPSTFELLHMLMFFFIMIVGIMSGRSLSGLATFLVLLNRIQPYLRAVQDSGAKFAGAAGTLKEVEFLLAQPMKRPEAADGVVFTSLHDRIEFRDVTFSYEGGGGAPVLDRIDISIRAGRSTAIIGRSGAGKSTVLMLLCRLIEPSGGLIAVDGVNLREIDYDSWLRNIGIAGHDLELVGGTIADNIAYGGPAMTRSEIEVAAKMAHADEFIRMLRDGYDTVLGDRGLALSSGQRQRLAIARALARNPSILILDEATNSVDLAAEKLINDVLATVSGRMTVIVVSHRSSSLALCDDGVVLKDGTVEDSGPLMSLEAYARMNDLI